MEQLRFNGDVVVVTGAGGGLGRAYALELGRRGARVVVNDLGGAPDGTGGSAGPAERVAQEIRDAGGQAVANTESVTSEAAGARIIQTALDTWGQIDGVIANAGILRDKSFAKLDMKDFEAVLDVHLRGTIFTCKPAFNAMRDAGRGGRIVMTTSASGLFGMYGQTSYAAAKMGIAGMTRILAFEGEKYGIKTNTIGPTAGTRLTSGQDTEDPNNPMAPARVASLAVALVHGSCPANGEIILAAGGWFARTYLAVGQGWAPEGGRFPTADDVAAHWDAIRDPSNPRDPKNAMDITNLMSEALGIKS